MSNDKVYMKEYYQKNKMRQRERRRIAQSKYRETHRDILSIRGKKYQQIRKINILAHYSPNGIPQCECCKEQRTVFLTIDHINGGGVRHRKGIGVGSGDAFYKWIVKNHYPPIFRILCFNCNFATHRLGICPHSTENKPPPP